MLSQNRKTSVRMRLGLYLTRAILSKTRLRHYIGSTSGGFNSTLKAPDASYGKEVKPRLPPDSHATLRDAVRFCQISTKCGPVRAPYPESVDI
jgi:hypothetical protein